MGRQIGNAPRLDIPNAEYVGPVAFSAFPQAVAQLHLDIGLAPLHDTAFNRCKTNLKWLEYSALGVPAVVSDVLPYSRSIQHGVDGLLVKTPEDCIRELKRLIRDPDLRREIGCRARESAVGRFGCPVIGDRYAELASRWTKRTTAAKATPHEISATPVGREIFFTALFGAVAAPVPLLTAPRDFMPGSQWDRGGILSSLLRRSLQSRD